MPSGCRCLHLVCLLCILGAPGQRVRADDCSSHCDLAHGCCAPDGSCRCDPGWEGLHCERCVRMPGCQHGTCHQPWQCICHSGWAGKFCDKVNIPLGPTSAVVVPATKPAPHSAGAGLLRISVKEVVRRQEAGLGEPSLVALVVFGALTAALVLATMLLTLRAWRRGVCPPGLCCYPAPRYAPACQDQECQVSMLPAGLPLPPDLPPEPGKTTAL
ncbi:PREDICTED: protein delta homolog 2 [Propithecus coquereli]|uniref:protein delta homolog 2 n=1 Tax=Propithecus coquereli TaxID=379532 RepID=UPI00063FA037|nr:PREDICTED: protein delta homolog 2 [Propithecus coquereli]